MTDAHGGAGRDESEGHSGTVPKDMSQDRKDSTGMAVPKASQPGGLAGPGLLLGLAAALLFAFVGGFLIFASFVARPMDNSDVGAEGIRQLFAIQQSVLQRGLA